MSRIRPTLAACLVVLLALVSLSPVVPARTAAAAATVTLTRSSAAPGDRVTLAGFGFTPGDAATIAATFVVDGHPQQVQSSGTVSESGTFSATFDVPARAQSGSVPVVARDLHDHAAGIRLAVLPGVTIYAGGTVYRVYVVAGHTFSLRGIGFRAGEAVRVRAVFPNYSGNDILVAKTVVTGASGAFGDLSITVPGGSRARTIDLTATGERSGRHGAAGVVILYRPSLVNATPVIRPGGTLLLRGDGFVPNASVTLSTVVARTAGGTLSVDKSVTTDGNGHFTTTFGLPSDVRAGTYTITAADALSGAHVATRVVVSVHPAISVSPTITLANRMIVITGSGYGLFTGVTVRAGFPRVGGGIRIASTLVNTDGRGTFSARLFVPRDAALGRVTITARSANAAAAAYLTVSRPAPVPTATPLPTSTPTPLPTATDTPTPKHHHRSLQFAYTSVWYHIVRAGTYDHLVVQGNLRTTLGVWVHVYLPNGRQLDYYVETDGLGHWETQFSVPAGATGAAVVTFRLWHGSANVKNFLRFNVVH